MNDIVGSIKIVSSYRVGQLEALYEKVSHYNILEPRSLSVKSILAYENGRYSESVQFLGKCIVLDPSVSGYQKQLAKACVKMFWWKQALKSLNRAIYADPNDPESWYGLGFIYDHVKNLDNAKFCYMQSLALDPSFRNARDALQTLNKIS